MNIPYSSVKSELDNVRFFCGDNESNSRENCIMISDNDVTIGKEKG